MRILQVIQSLKVGGAERVCLDLSYGLANSGHTVEVVLLQDKIELDVLRYGKAFQVAPLIPGEQPIWIRNIPALSNAFCKVYSQGWDIIHCHMDGALNIAALGGGRRICYTVHNSVHGHWEGIGLHRVRAISEFFITRRMDIAVVGCGPGAYEWAERKLGAGRQVKYVSNGIDVEEFQRKENYTLHDPVRILMVGKLAPTKDHSTAIRAMSQLIKFGINAHLSIAGDGGLLESLEKWIVDSNLQENVSLLGLRKDIPDLMRAADIFWITSLHEGLPLVLLEAMAVGVPVVATDAPGIREIVDKSLVRLVPVSDDLALAKETRVLLDHYDQMGEMETKIREFVVDGYSVQRMADEYMRIYEKLLS